MYEWVVFLHVAAVMGFMLAHGVHVAAMWAMRGEADPERMLTFFNDLPSALVLRILLAVVVATGMTAGFMGSWWAEGWMWASLLMLAAIAIVMWRYGGGFYGLMQEAAERAVAARSSEPSDPGLQGAYDAARRSWHTVGVSAIGLGGLAIILWLMMFKPF